MYVIMIGTGNRGINYATTAKEECAEFEMVAIAAEESHLNGTVINVQEYKKRFL